MATYDELEQLVETFTRDIEIAKGVESTNPEDDLAVKAAVVGFSYNSSTGEWAKGHYDFLMRRIEADYDAESLEEYGENGTNVKLFFALAMGYLLGLYQHEKISEDEFKVGEQQIPGIIMLHLPKLMEQPV
jgi:hypothetical protein